MEKKPLYRRPIVVAFVLVLVLLGGFLAGRVTADQPHMQAALDALRLANKELELASADKGGHRARAIAHVREAIVEVERGIAFDRSH